jgi:hypothetical protein
VADREPVDSQVTDSLVQSLDTSMGPRVVMTPCGYGEIHLFQVESPMLWNRTVPCTLLLFTYVHSFLKNGADLTLYVWRVI